MSKEEFEDFKKEDRDVSEIISKFHQELIDRIRTLEKENEELREYKLLSPKFYFDPNEDCYAFVDRSSDSSNMSLRRIEYNGEVIGYASECYPSFKTDLDDYMNANGYKIKPLEPLKSISFTTFYHEFIKPIFKMYEKSLEENSNLTAEICELKEKLNNIEEDY